jgi:ribonuclease P protein component
MLPALLRFPLRSFPNFFRQSRSQRSANLLVRWQNVALPVSSQAAVIVSKKTAPLATQRNLIKRKIRVALFKTQPLWNGKQLVVQALRRDILTQKSDDLVLELTKLFS